MCVLGNRLLRVNDISHCTKNVSGPLYQEFCPNNTCYDYWLKHNLTVEMGIKGLASGVFFGIAFNSNFLITPFKQLMNFR